MREHTEIGGDSDTLKDRGESEEGLYVRVREGVCGFVNGLTSESTSKERDVSLYQRLAS